MQIAKSESIVLTREAEPCRSTRVNWNAQIRRHAMMTPDAIALSFKDRSTTWLQLQERISCFASFLEKKGIGFGDRVLILMFNRPEFVESVLALNLLGAIAVPVNFRMTASEVAFIAQDCDARAIITDAPLEALVAQVVDRTTGIAFVVTAGTTMSGSVINYETALSENNSPKVIDIPDDTPALIMYTSGTTGNPKGAVLTHSNMQSQALTCIRALQLYDPDDIGFCAAPMFHIAALGSMAPSFVLGLSTIIYPTGTFDAAEVLDALSQGEVTTTFFVPTQWQVLCEEQLSRPRELKLKVISWGAAPASDSLLHSMSKAFPSASNIAVFGQTEMSPITCVLEGRDAIRKLGSVGKVVPTVQARIVDDNMNDVGVGKVGEIVYRGPTMMREYWNNPSATAEAFAGGWFHSGDLVRMDEEGFIFVVDRKKDMIISGGENIYCAEIENVLHGHPGIAEVALIGKPDKKWGEVGVAVLAATPGADVRDLSVQVLSEWLDARLARYKHPKVTMLVEALPRNASGKVLKSELRSLVKEK
ncbi:MAG: fatty-acid--CoA ligase FadD5 [Mycobacteriaceae bacterium]